MKKSFALLMASMMVLTLLAGCGNNATPAPEGDKPAGDAPAKTYNIIAAHGAAESTTAAKGWLKFKELIEKESGGAITVEVYANQELGGDREYTEACTQGNVTMGGPSTAPLAAFDPAMNVFETPFLFDSREKAYEVLDGEQGKVLLGSLESSGLKGLGYFENGFRELTANKVVKSPADLTGLKIRVMENDVHLAIWSALGANPSPLAFGELFTALQQKTFDAQENPLELIYNTKFFEVQKYVMMTNHIYTPYVIYMNMDFWNSLPVEYQEMVQSCVDQAVAYQRDLCVQAEKDCRDGITATGKCEVIDLTDEERASFADACTPVYKMVRESAGGTYADDLYKAAGKTF